MPASGLVPARIMRSLLNVIFFVGAAVAGLAIVGTLLVAAFGDEDFRGDVSVPVAIGDSSLVPIVRFPSDSPAALTSPAVVGGHAELRFETADRMLILLTMGAIFAGVLVVLYGVWTLRGMLDRVLAGKPFDPANVRALHVLAAVVVLGAVGMQAMQFIAARHVLAVVDVQGISLSPSINRDFTPLLVALMLEVLAAIFRHGAELEAEQSLTI